MAPKSRQPSTRLEAPPRPARAVKAIMAALARETPALDALDGPSVDLVGWVAAAIERGERASELDALNLANELLGSFRAQDLVMPEVFIGRLTCVFQEFPFEVGEMVIDPIEGPFAQARFPPAIGEVLAALWAASDSVMGADQAVKRVRSAAALAYAHPARPEPTEAERSKMRARIDELLRKIGGGRASLDA